MKTKIIAFLLISLFIFSFNSCRNNNDDDDNNDDQTTATPYSLKIPPGWPTIVNIPEDNPMTVEGIKLGRYLFYDGRMSGRNHPDSLMSCGTCHLQEYAFEIGTNHPDYPNGRPHGLTGIPTPHVMLPFINLAWNTEGYLWNGMINEENPALGASGYGVPPLPEFHMKNIESLVWMGIHAPHEMNGTVDKTVSMISSIDMYKPMFKAAFGDETVTYERISKSIAQFIRTLISSNSKFDQKLRGDYQFTNSENRGLILFVTEEGGDCFHCHGASGNPLMTTHLFYNNAKDANFNDPRDRYGYTGNPSDKGAYKATTLRNIELTGPYMHDGRFMTLKEVIDFYSEGLVYSQYAHPLMHKLEFPYGNGAELDPQDKDDLIAFLKTLTDYDFITNPDYSDPFAK